MNKFSNHLKRFNKFYRDLLKNKSKKYENEEAIISMTSWKARINTCYKTILSLINQSVKCHIVLVLSSNEFPKKERELPQNLLLLLDYFEILWVKENTKAFKKVYPTIVKYQNLDVPILCADDDCLYITTYAEEMITTFNKEGRDCFVRYSVNNISRKTLPHLTVGGASGLYPPCYFRYLIDYYFKILKNNDKKIIYEFGDDSVCFVIYKNKLKLKIIHDSKDNIPPHPFKFHDQIQPLHQHIKNDKRWSNC